MQNQSDIVGIPPRHAPNVPPFFGWDFLYKNFPLSQRGIEGDLEKWRIIK
jgi:hypothetical protein